MARGGESGGVSADCGKDFRLFRIEKLSIFFEDIMEAGIGFSLGFIPSPGIDGVGLSCDQSPVDGGDSALLEDRETLFEGATRGPRHVFRTEQRSARGNIADKVDPFPQFARLCVGVEGDLLRS